MIEELIIPIFLSIIVILLLVFGIMLVPSLRVYLENKSKQRTVKVVEKNNPVYIPVGTGMAMPSGGQGQPEIKVDVNLGDLLKNQGKVENVPKVDDEKKALEKLERKKETFIPFNERDDVKVEFDDFGKEYKTKE